MLKINKVLQTNRILLLLFTLIIIGEGNIYVSAKEGKGCAGYWKFDEGNGVLVKDSSGNGNDGYIINEATWTQGFLGSALKFSSNQYIDCDRDASLKITGDITITAWIKITAETFPDGTTNWTIANSESYENYGFIFRIDGGTGQLYYRTNQAGASQASQSAIPLSKDTFCHVAVVRSGASAAFYINGVATANDVRGIHLDPVASSDSLSISTDRQAMIGIIDEVRIFNYALSAKEVNELTQGDLKLNPQLLGIIEHQKKQEKLIKDSAVNKQGAFILASSMLDFDTYYPDNLIDGNLSTVWRSLDADTPQWLEVRWDDPVSMNQVLLKESGDSNIRDLSLYQWQQEEWKLIKQVDCEAQKHHGEIEISFSELTTERLRIEILRNSGSYTQLAEIVVLGSKRPLPPLKLSSSVWRANHIWSHESDKVVKIEPRWLRKTFQVKNFKDLKNAFILARSNDYYIIYLNGVKVEEGAKRIFPIEITKYLKEGNNCLAVRCDVFSNPGWPRMSLILETIINTALETQYVITDETWKVCRTEQSDWEKSGFDDSKWESVMVIGRVPIEPWSYLAYFNLGIYEQQEQMIVESIAINPINPKVSEEAEVSICLRPISKLSQPFVFIITIGEESLNRDFANYKWAKFIIEPDRSADQWSIGETITIKRKLYVPSYAVHGFSPIFFKGVGLVNGSELQFLNAHLQDLKGVIGQINVVRPNLPVFKITKDFHMVKENGIIKLIMDNQKHVPIFWAMGNVSLPRYQSFSTTGIKLYHLQIYPFGNVGDDVYDSVHFPHIDNHIRHLLRIDPAAHFIVEMYMREGGIQWRRYQKELIETAFGKKVGGVSFASEKYAKECQNFVRRLCRFLESQPYASHVIGYLPELAEAESFMGGTSENEFQLDRSKITIGDWSESGISYFRNFLREKYAGDVSMLREAWKDSNVTFETAKPVQSELGKEGDKGGLFRNPTEGRMAFDLFECNITMVPRFLIENIGKVIKEETKGRALVLSYYGYTLEHLRPNNSPGTILQGLHSYLYKMLESPYFDGFASPLEYGYSRFAGQKFTSFLPYASVRLHNKLHIAEMDYRTYVASLKSYGRHKSDKETRAVLTRDLGTVIIQGSGAWLADWSSPGAGGRKAVSYFDQPDILDTIKMMHGIYMKTRDLARKSATEIAVIVSDKTLYYHDIYHASVLYRNLIHRLLPEELSQIGAPYDLYEINDLGHEFVQKQYKLYIFLNPYFMTNQERSWVESLKCDGKTMLWIYAPGYVSNENGLQLNTVEKMTGMKMGISYKKEHLRMNILDKKHPILQGVNSETEISMLGFDHPREKKIHPLEISPRFWVEDVEATTLATYSDGKAALAVKEFPGYKSVYTGVPFLTKEVLRNIAQFAGVHLYAPLNVIVEADHNFLLLHNGFTGRKKFDVQLLNPCTVEDLFSGKIISEGKKQFVVDLPECETYFFLLSPKTQ